MFVGLKGGAAGVTHVSGRQPQVEGAAVLLTVLDRQNSNCRETLTHHQPAEHPDPLKHTHKFKVVVNVLMLKAKSREVLSFDSQLNF